MTFIKETLFEIKFVFKHDNQFLKGEIIDFWKANKDSYLDELRSYYHFKAIDDADEWAFSSPTNSEVAAIARNNSNEIIGIAFVDLKEIDKSLSLGTHAYFQKVFVLSNYRSPKLTWRLFTCFVKGFSDAKSSRDFRAKSLVSENINPKMKNPYLRRCFSKLGYKMMGKNNFDGEIWYLPLKTSYKLHKLNQA